MNSQANIRLKIKTFIFNIEGKDIFLVGGGGGGAVWVNCVKRFMLYINFVKLLLLRYIWTKGIVAYAIIRKL